MAVVTLMVLLAMAQGALAWREGRPRMVVNYMAGEQGEFSVLISHLDDAVTSEKEAEADDFTATVERNAHRVHCLGHSQSLLATAASLVKIEFDQKKSFLSCPVIFWSIREC